nr:carbohydrate binding family 9 domain-containing protein [Bacteroidota bacterium]
MKKLYLLVLAIFIGISLYPQKQSYRTAKITDQPPQIDGNLNDTAWNIVEWEGNFVQWEPYEGKPPSQPTFFKIIYDDNNLYVGIVAYDSLPNEIVKRMSRRDGFEGDFVEINIDSHLDHMTAYSFTLNAAGVKGDELITEDGDNWDPTWDPIWYAKTALTDTGWVAEFKIPFTQLRFGKKDNHTWGMQVTRRLFRKEERSVWQLIPREENGWVSKFGELQGIHGIKPKRQIDIVPYVIARQEYNESEEGNPFATGKQGKIDGGLDGKIGISNDLTLDFTINPDFGQVEADPSEVNLTAYETFFEEKRPFFIEGNNIFNFQITGGGNNFSSDNLFYTRRIGRNPHFYPDLNDNEYAKTPDNTTILGAFKLSGKTKKGWSVGILESVTQRETAEIYSEGNSRYEEVEPLTNYFVARLEKDIDKGNTVIGGMFTSTNRDIENPEIDFIAKNAYTGGLNLRHYWKNKAWMVALRTVFSSVYGDTATMVNLQESPVRYFQRPDASYVRVDSTRTSLQGQGGTLEFGKTGEGHFRFLTWVTWR